MPCCRKGNTPRGFLVPPPPPLPGQQDPDGKAKCSSPNCMPNGSTQIPACLLDPGIERYWNSLSLEQRRQLLKLPKKEVFQKIRGLYCSGCFGLFQLCYDELKSYLAGGYPVCHTCYDGLVVTDDGSLTLDDKMIRATPFPAFNVAKARELQREQHFPTVEICGNGWIKRPGQNKCKLHSGAVPYEALMDFWANLPEEARKALCSLSEDDFLAELDNQMKFQLHICKECRCNVMRAFKELKPSKTGEVGSTASGLLLCEGHHLKVSDGQVRVEGAMDATFFDKAQEVEEQKTFDTSTGADPENPETIRHAETPELAREALQDSSLLIFKSQVEIAFREQTASHNALLLFVYMTHHLLEQQLCNSYRELGAKQAEAELLQLLEADAQKDAHRKEKKAAKKKQKKGSTGPMHGLVDEDCDSCSAAATATTAISVSSSKQGSDAGHWSVESLSSSPRDHSGAAAMSQAASASANTSHQSQSKPDLHVNTHTPVRPGVHTVHKGNGVTLLSDGTMLIHDFDVESDEESSPTMSTDSDLDGHHSASKGAEAKKQESPNSLANGKHASQHKPSGTAAKPAAKALANGSTSPTSAGADTKLSVSKKPLPAAASSAAQVKVASAQQPKLASAHPATAKPIQAAPPASDAHAAKAASIKPAQAAAAVPAVPQPPPPPPKAAPARAQPAAAAASAAEPVLQLDSSDFPPLSSAATPSISPAVAAPALPASTVVSPAAPAPSLDDDNFPPLGSMPKAVSGTFRSASHSAAATSNATPADSDTEDASPSTAPAAHGAALNATRAPAQEPVDHTAAPSVHAASAAAFAPNTDVQHSVPLAPASPAFSAASVPAAPQHGAPSPTVHALHSMSSAHNQAVGVPSVSVPSHVAASAAQVHHKAELGAGFPATSASMLPPDSHLRAPTHTGSPHLHNAASFPSMQHLPELLPQGIRHLHHSPSEPVTGSVGMAHLQGSSTSHTQGHPAIQTPVAGLAQALYGQLHQTGAVPSLGAQPSLAHQLAGAQLLNRAQQHPGSFQHSLASDYGLLKPNSNALLHPKASPAVAGAAAPQLNQASWQQSWMSNQPAATASQSRSFDAGLWSMPGSTCGSGFAGLGSGSFCSAASFDAAAKECSSHFMTQLSPHFGADWNGPSQFAHDSGFSLFSHFPISNGPGCDQPAASPAAVVAPLPPLALPSVAAFPVPKVAPVVPVAEKKEPSTRQEPVPSYQLFGASPLGSLISAHSM